MAHHRSSTGGRGVRGRGVSRGLIFALLSIILIAAVVVVWQRLGDHIDQQADDAAGRCVEGAETVTVVADPDLVEALSQIAVAFGETKPVVRDKCISVAVVPKDAKVTLDALTGHWDTESMGAAPAAWIPQSSVWAAELSAARPDAVEGKARSLVSSPVVLAVSPQLAEAVDGKLDWAAVPTLQRRDASLADYGWQGSLRMAMPNGAQSDASALAAQAVANQIARTMGQLTADDANSERVSSSVRAMLEGAPASPDGTPAGAARVIADADDATQAPIRAVPITEQKLYTLTRDDPRPRLAEVLPNGPTPVADYPVIRLAGTAVSDAATDAVAEFIDFAAEPEQLRRLTALGFRGDAPMPKATPTVTFPRTPNPMGTPEAAAIVAINRLVFGAATRPAPVPAPQTPTSEAPASDAPASDSPASDSPAPSGPANPPASSPAAGG